MSDVERAWSQALRSDRMAEIMTAANRGLLGHGDVLRQIFDMGWRAGGRDPARERTDDHDERISRPDISE